MKSGRSSVDYLRDILEYTDVATELLGDMGLEKFQQDRRTHLAVVRALEVIGEAGRQVAAPASTRARFRAR